MGRSDRPDFQRWKMGQWAINTRAMQMEAQALAIELIKLANRGVLVLQHEDTTLISHVNLFGLH